MITTIAKPTCSLIVAITNSKLDFQAIHQNYGRNAVFTVSLGNLYLFLSCLMPLSGIEDDRMLNSWGICFAYKASVVQKDQTCTRPREIQHRCVELRFWLRNLRKQVRTESLSQGWYGRGCSPYNGDPSVFLKIPTENQNGKPNQKTQTKDLSWSSQLKGTIPPMSMASVSIAIKTHNLKFSGIQIVCSTCFAAGLSSPISGQN